MKAEWEDGEISWVKGVGENDCLTNSNDWDEEALGSEIGVHIDQLVTDSNDLTGARLWVAGDCHFNVAAVKAGEDCQIVGLSGPTTIFTNVTQPSISHFEAIVVCCVVAD